MATDNKKSKVSKDEHMLQMAFVFLIFGLILWFIFGQSISKAYIQIMQWQITMMHGVANLFGIHADGMHNFLKTVNSYDFGTKIDIAELQIIAEHGEVYTKWMNISLFSLLIIYALIRKKTSPNRKYNRVFTAEPLIQELSKAFLRIRPILHLKFGQDDKDRGAFTWMLSPFEWAVEREVIIDHGQPIKTKKTFDPTKCKQELINDIQSEVYQGVGPDQLDIIRRYIFAVYSLWYLERYKEHNELLDLGSIWFKVIQKDGKKDSYEWNISSKWVDKINKICKEGIAEPRVKRIITSYVFVDSILKALMSEIPKTTVAYYIWLKAINKNLYYTLHQTGQETSPILVKGMTEIYEHEVKLVSQGKRLVTQQEQESLTKKDILSRLDLNSWVSDVWWSLEESGFMKTSDIIHYTEEELKGFEQTGEIRREVDLTKPIEMYYIESTGGDKNATRTINTIIFFDPFDHEVLKEIKLPKGRLDSASKSAMEYYLYNNYIHVADSEKVKNWLVARGINENIIFFFITYKTLGAVV